MAKRVDYLTRENCRKLRFFPLVVIVFVLCGAIGTLHAKDPTLSFEKYVLDNGLEVILHQDNSVPIVAVDVWYHVGSGDEVIGKSGFAHLFEHMLFQGSQHVGEDQHFAILKQIGASGVNGTTSTDRTNYFEVVPSNQLETALWLESDRMGYLLPVLTQKSLDNQIEVVRNERRQRYDNAPYGKAYLAMNSLLYPESHPYHYSVIGKHADLANAKLEDVRAFYKKWYVPSNGTLVIAGDFEVPEAKRLVKKWFGTFPALPKPSHIVPSFPSVSHKREQIRDNFAKLRKLDFVWHTPAFLTPGDAEFDIVAHVLGSQVGRLTKSLVNDKQLAQAVYVYQDSQQFSSLFVLSIVVKSNANLSEIEKVLETELQRLASEPITSQEFRRAIVEREASYIRRLEKLIHRAELLQSYNHYVQDPNYITKDLDRYRKSSPKVIRDYVRNYLKKQHRVEILTVPSKERD